MNDALGDRMKLYESAECGRRFMPLLPVVARIDGRAFSKFTRDFDRPFDARMSLAMKQTALALAKETGANMAYTQSDEITLCWHSTDPKSQIWFDGRITKMTSQLAAQATLFFDRNIPSSTWRDRLPTFDARVWTVPTRTEAANVFVWREQDATKNSISMAASHYYSPKALHGLSGSDKQELLFVKGVNWNNYPSFFKRGTYIQRRKEAIKFSAAEIEKLPPKHAARTNPDLMVERSVLKELDMPIFTTVTNREAVIFDGAEPITKTINEYATV
jgi:tRNA(His) guanylyltransferase